MNHKTRAAFWRVSPRAILCALISLSFLVALPLASFADVKRQAPYSEDKPFAQAHIVLQVSDGERATHSAVLDIANNLLKHYGGQDMADVEVVTFGAGVALVIKTAGERANEYAERISSLQAHGVRFVVCGNTLDTLARKSGKTPAVLPGVIRVQTGVAHLIDRQQSGFVVIRP